MYKSLSYRSLILTLAGTMLAGVALGCADDPYSQKRIRARTAHFNETAQAIEKHEAEGPERLRGRQRELDRWWKSDEEQFRTRAAQVGDYIY